MSAPAAALPVAGSFIYHGGDHGDVVVRIAVHALRRVAQRTVLDWSITPLVAPASPQTATSAWARPISVGLRRTRAVTRGHRWPQGLPPLIEGKQINAVCVCAAYLGGTGDLRLGRTTLFQLAFPSLPGTLATVDVTDNGFVVPGVPLTPVGEVPTVGTPVDLAAPATSGLGSTAADGPRTVNFNTPKVPTSSISAQTQPMTLASTASTATPAAALCVTSPPSLRARTQPGGGLPVTIRPARERTVQGHRQRPARPCRRAAAPLRDAAQQLRHPPATQEWCPTPPARTGSSACARTGSAVRPALRPRAVPSPSLPLSRPFRRAQRPSA